MEDAPADRAPARTKRAETGKDTAARANGDVHRVDKADRAKATAAETRTAADVRKEVPPDNTRILRCSTQSLGDSGVGLKHFVHPGSLILSS